MTALPPKWVWSVNSTEALAESCKTKPGLQAVLLGDGLERSHEWLTMNFRQCGASISASLFRLHDFNFPPVAFTLNDRGMHLHVKACICLTVSYRTEGKGQNMFYVLRKWAAAPTLWLGRGWVQLGHAHAQNPGKAWLGLRRHSAAVTATTGA